MPRELANIFNDIYLDEFNTNLPYFNNSWKDNSSDIESEDKIVVKNMEEYPRIAQDRLNCRTEYSNVWGASLGLLPNIDRPQEQHVHLCTSKAQYDC